jgi:6-phosphogluconolactonase
MQIVVAENQEKGIEKAKEILEEKVDKKTVLFLSGGSTPKSLYQLLAKEKILTPAAVGMIDERFGAKWHENSNERMIQESGLLDYLQKIHVPFYPILNGHPEQSEGSHAKHKGVRDSSAMPQNDNTRKQTAQDYDQISRDLFFKFPRSVAIMGVGTDGHTSSIIPSRKDFVDPMFEEAKQHLFVGELNDAKGPYGERVGMTFSGLSLIDYFVVLVFGKEKRKALKKMLENGPLEEIPARFFNQDAAEKTIVITDQKI